jgi:hypothetical protein
MYWGRRNRADRAVKAHPPERPITGATVGGRSTIAAVAPARPMAHDLPTCLLCRSKHSIRCFQPPNSAELGRSTSQIEHYRRSAGRSNKRKAGGRYAADLVLRLPARGSGSVAFHFPIIESDW